jgi:predicted SAM-dependent methyltransferase
MMTIRRRVQRALRRVPPLFHAIRAVLSAGRTIFGPAWLKRQVERHRAAGKPLRIVIGSSQVFDKGWIPTNVQYLNLLNDQQWQHAFGDARLDAILTEHVWEHLALADSHTAAAQCFKYLKPGGYLRIAVPDGNHPDPDYIEFVRPNGSGSGAWDHKVLYTFDTLRDVLQGAGFTVDLLEYYDAAGQFHAVPWDQKAGRIWRCKGYHEQKRDGSDMNYSSLIVDARKPVG